MSDDKIQAEIEARVHARVADLVNELSYVELGRRKLETSTEEEIKQVSEAILSKVQPEMKAFSVRGTQIMEELNELTTKYESLLFKNGSRSFKIRDIIVSIRRSAGSVVIDNNEKALKWLRKNRLITPVTKRGKLSIDKTKLKQRPDIVDRMPDAYIDTPEFLSVKLPEPQIEIRKERHPLRRVRSK